MAVNGVAIELEAVNVILAQKLESDSIGPTCVGAPSTTATTTTIYIQGKTPPCTPMHSCLTNPYSNLHF